MNPVREIPMRAPPTRYRYVIIRVEFAERIGSWREASSMKWLRFFFIAVVFASISCSTPTVPKYPDPDDPPGEDPTDPGEKGGFLLPPSGDVTFWV